MQRFEALTPHFEFRVDVCTGKTETLIVYSDHSYIVSEGEVPVPVSIVRFAEDSRLVHNQYKSEPEWAGVHGPVLRINTEFGYYIMSEQSMFDSSDDSDEE